MVNVFLIFSYIRRGYLQISIFCLIEMFPQIFSNFSTKILNQISLIKFSTNFIQRITIQILFIENILNRTFILYLYIDIVYSSVKMSMRLFFYCSVTISTCHIDSKIYHNQFAKTYLTLARASNH